MSSPCPGHKSTSSPCSHSGSLLLSSSGMSGPPALLFSSRLGTDVCRMNEPLHNRNAEVKVRDGSPKQAPTAPFSAQDAAPLRVCQRHHLWLLSKTLVWGPHSWPNC